MLNTKELSKATLPVISAHIRSGIYQAKISLAKSSEATNKTTGNKDLNLVWGFTVGTKAFEAKQRVSNYNVMVKSPRDGREFSPMSSFVHAIREHMGLPMDKELSIPAALEWASKNFVTCKASINEAGFPDFRPVMPIVIEEVAPSQTEIAALFAETEVSE